MAGWNLTGKLIARHLGKLGETLAGAIASFDPETATQVDRDNLQGKLREVASKLAEARQKLSVETKEAEALAAQISKDENAAGRLLALFDEKKVDEATLTEFTDNLEAMKARLPGERQDVTDSNELVDTLQDILNTIEKNLTEFDRHAKAAIGAIERAKAEKQRQALRVENQAQLSQLSGGQSPSSALSALNRKASQLTTEAEATRIVADIGQKPVDRSNAIDNARRLASGATDTSTETAADRLRRIAKTAETAQ